MIQVAAKAIADSKKNRCALNVAASVLCASVWSWAACRGEPTQPADVSAVNEAQFKKTREELLARGAPEVMQKAPVLDLNEKPAAIDSKALLKELVKPVDNDRVLVGDIQVDLAVGRVDVPARIALKEGVLEYGLVTKGGKAYESLLVTDVPPLHLQLALTLAGLSEASVDKKTAGDPVALTVRLREPGAAKDSELPVSELMVDRNTGKPPSSVTWRFSGSPMRGSQIWASMTGSLIALRADNSAVINAVADLGNPYAGPNSGVAANGKRLPEAGTAVVLSLVRSAP